MTLPARPAARPSTARTTSPAHCDVALSRDRITTVLLIGHPIRFGTASFVRSGSSWHARATLSPIGAATLLRRTRLRREAPASCLTSHFNRGLRNQPCCCCAQRHIRLFGRNRACFWI